MQASPQLVINWRARGQVSQGFAIAVSRATGWKVTPHSLRPDIYRHPEDGLPAELRGLPQEASA